MSAHKHTAAPWSVKHLATYDEPGYVVMWPDKGGQHMRRLDYRGCFIGADARLIAAAPDLLAALVAIVERCGSRSIYCTDQETGEPFDMIAKAAIARATDGAA